MPGESGRVSEGYHKVLVVKHKKKAMISYPVEYTKGNLSVAGFHKFAKSWTFQVIYTTSISFLYKIKMYNDEPRRTTS